MDISKKLRSDGFAVLKNAISAEAIQSVLDFLASHIPEHQKAAMALGELENLDFESGQLATGHFSLPVRLSKDLWEIPRDPRLRAVLQEALGSTQIFMHMPPTARFVAPGNLQAAVPPHQDWQYNEHLPPFLTVWIPLVEIDDLCGGVAVYPDSRDHHVQTGARSSIWHDAVDTSGLTSSHCAPMSPGDVLILEPTLIHASMPNMSDRIRISVDMRFFSTPLSGKHFLDMQSWTVREPNLEKAI